MARISGGAKDRLINDGFMNASAAWTDEKAFGSTNTQRQEDGNGTSKETTAQFTNS